MANPPDNSGKLGRLRALQEAYGIELPQRLAAIRSQLDSIRRNLSNTEALPELHRLVHSLAGSAGTFGYTKLGEQARQLEILLHRVVSAPSTLAPQVLDTMVNHLASLSEAMKDRSAPPPVSLPPTVNAPENRLLFLVDDDRALTAEMSAQLDIYGWQSRVFHDAASAREAMRNDQPAAIVIDMMLPEGALAGVEMLQHLDEDQRRIPTIVVSSRWDWESRLGAARAGVDAYLVKPVDSTTLNERLDSLVRPRHNIPAIQILIVEDSNLLACRYAEVLRQSGMTVEALEDPTLILETLERFSPDLILLDLYMPGCNGIEAARVIRQDSRFTDLPIIFLSTESSRQLQLAAMQTGADDFLEKPISDKDLVTAVTLRAERFQGLRELIRQDRMTGLLNHIAFHLQLEFELARQQRTGGQLSVVMLDIDHFKKVNDTHGHPVGDKVIRSLSGLLSNRLRKTDIVGRYGGEEFAVIMPDTPLADACKVIDQLREEFRQILHVSGDKEFRCSFSAGVACLPMPVTKEVLLEKADEALYASKRGGRNRVTAASVDKSAAE